MLPVISHINATVEPHQTLTSYKEIHALDRRDLTLVSAGNNEAIHCFISYDQAGNSNTENKSLKVALL
jgi:hypothetical protein